MEGAYSDITGLEWRSVLDEFGGVARVVEVVRKSFEVILAIYERGHVAAQHKANGSPVSEADMAAAAYLESALRPSHIAIVCEESISATLPHPPTFWLVDPLDGTKEFLARNGEFTVNVGLVAGSDPVLGVIGIPVQGVVYFACRGSGAYRQDADGTVTQIRNTRTETELIAAVSRSHASERDQQWLRDRGVREVVTSGSAIKFCRVAEGSADIYARFGRTMEWDTAAGHCILLEAGCTVVELDSGTPLTYGKPDYANPSFVACRKDVRF